MIQRHLLVFELAAAILLSFQAHVRAADLPPEVNNISSSTTIFGEIVSLQITATNDPEAWSMLPGPTYTPGFGSPNNAPGLLIPPMWNPATQFLVWDTAGSSSGTYLWTVVASNAAGSDSGTITFNNIVYELYPVPKFNHLRFTAQSPLANGGVVGGKLTATEDPYDWSQLLYPSFKTEKYGPVSTPTGIQTPNWDAGTQQFSWDMQGAKRGIYTWYVKARSYHGYSAGAIEVTILVPEPGTALLTLLALLAAASVVRQRNR